MKKSRPLLIVGAALLSAGLWGESLSLQSFESSDGGAVIACRFDFIDQEELLTALDEGETVHLILSVRSASPRRYSLDSDAERRRINRSARWDGIEQLYIIRNQESKAYYLHKDAFLSAFLDFRIPEPDDNSEERYFRGEVRWSELHPPMNILSPFLGDLYQRTAWIRFASAEERGENE